MFSLEKISKTFTFRNNFSKKDAHAEHGYKKSFFLQSLTNIYEIKQNKQAKKNENMEKGDKPFILLKLHKNTGHITNISLCSHLQWNNHKQQAHQV